MPSCSGRGGCADDRPPRARRTTAWTPSPFCGARISRAPKGCWGPHSISTRGTLPRSCGSSLPTERRAPSPERAPKSGRTDVQTVRVTVGKFVDMDNRFGGGDGRRSPGSTTTPAAPPHLGGRTPSSNATTRVGNRSSSAAPTRPSCPLSSPDPRLRQRWCGARGQGWRDVESVSRLKVRQDLVRLKLAGVVARRALVDDEEAFAVA